MSRVVIQPNFLTALCHIVAELEEGRYSNGVGGSGGGGGGAEKGFAVLRVEPGLNEVRTAIKRPPTQTRFQKKQKRREGRGRNPVGN